ncbi:hypothetical protein PsorP6_009924 [Peronosclerospora sorghi]|uniref:Uncharacterized protein n=1 Tax=Peronosclerospora sorghi TaxID=230839 RepID=A0ACC0VXW9_9STRA|nr:hypothetical protein PsorP6_009924 [Peronosclerospora sorghi]
MNVVKLPCLHLVHEDCLLEWLHSSIICPMCREEPSTAYAAALHLMTMLHHHVKLLEEEKMLVPVRVLFFSRSNVWCGSREVLERFDEFGWQPFVEPAETFEFFTVSGIFRRANVDTSLHEGHLGPQSLVQRNARFDVCVKCGLTHLLASYIRAEKASTKACAGVKNYVLNKPIAVQQWARHPSTRGD